MNSLTRQTDFQPLHVAYVLKAAAFVFVFRSRNQSVVAAFLKESILQSIRYLEFFSLPVNGMIMLQLNLYLSLYMHQLHSYKDCCDEVFKRLMNQVSFKL